MKVILLKEVENLGDEGAIVTVKDGYGRNYLIPRGLARIATAGSVRTQEEESKQRARKLSAQADQARNLARQLEAVELEIPVRTGDEGRIFGTVTTSQIADLLAQQGFEVDRRRIELDEDVRTTGAYSVSARLHPEVTARFKVRVVSENEAA